MTEKCRNIRVAVRVRPFNRRELELSQRTIIKVLDQQNLLFDPDDDEDEFFFHGTKINHRDITKRVNKKLNMEFDNVFDDESSNEDVFSTCMKPLISSVMDGYNCSVFVYGATGAGKTYTMLGTEEYPGITFLTMRELFSQIESLGDERKFDIGVSYLEVYNEQVMNLLTKAGPLKLREDSNGVVVGGLCLRPIFSAEELLNLLALGNRNRTQHPTDANEESSRSHAIFQVHIRMMNKKTTQKRTVKLSMIDLAGSERAASTKCMGLRFKEGASINKSLLALGNCINKLVDGSKHIPYRDSNLTRILKDSLGGNCQTVMIANISPSSLTYEDTYNTLKYASRAKKIRTTCKQNILRSNMPTEFYARKVDDQQKEIERLKALVKQLEEKLAQKNTEENKENKPESVDQTKMEQAVENLGPWYLKIDTVYAKLRKALEKYLIMQSKEKILGFRIKLKELAESQQKVLYLDGSHLDGDIARLEASIDKYSKQTVDQKEYLLNWKKQFNEFDYEVKCLKEEITEQNLMSQLSSYISSKDFEVEAIKYKMKLSHANKINLIYKSEADYNKMSILLSSEIHQQSYLLLRATNQLDANLKERYEKLIKYINGNRGIKFMDDKNDTIEDLFTLNDFYQNDNNDEDCPPNKRSRTESNLKTMVNFTTTSNCPRNLFKDETNIKINRLQNLPQVPLFNGNENMDRSGTELSLNETLVISKGPTSLFSSLEPMEGIKAISDLNNTYQISDSNPISTVLAEQNINTMQNHAKILKQVLKTTNKANILNKVTQAISKENKKFSPNRVKKSPRVPHRMVIGPRFNAVTNATISRSRLNSADKEFDKKTKFASQIIRTKK